MSGARHSDRTTFPGHAFTDPWLVIWRDPLRQVPIDVPLPDDDGPAAHHLRLSTSMVGQRGLIPVGASWIPVDDPWASPRHLVLERRSEGAILVADLGSIGGTTLNGSPLGRRAWESTMPGDILRLGLWTMLRVEERGTSLREVVRR